MSQTVDHWLSRLAPRNVVVSGLIFKRWMAWLEVNGGEIAHLGPDELVEHQLVNRDYSILDYVQVWVVRALEEVDPT